MKSTWLHYAACVLCSGGLLFNATSMADEKSDMDKRMMECAATTATDQLGECLASKGAPAVSAKESDADVHAAVLKCAERGVTGTTELGACVNSRLDETNTQPADVTDAQIQDAARLCAKHYTETKDIAVCVGTVLRHRGSASPK
jgi:hypothetical protein